MESTAIQKCMYCDIVTHECNHACTIECKRPCGLAAECKVDPCDEPHVSVCNNEICNLKFEIDCYKSKLEESETDRINATKINNQFRTLLLSPGSLKKSVEDGTFDVTTCRLYLSRQRGSIEQLDIETLLVLMNLYEEFAKFYAEVVHAKSTKISIKKELISRRKKEDKAATAFVEKEVATAKDKTFFKSTVGRAVKGAMKNLNLDRETAEKMAEELKKMASDIKKGQK
jgi:hypothetical protein